VDPDGLTYPCHNDRSYGFAAGIGSSGGLPKRLYVFATFTFHTSPAASRYSQAKGSRLSASIW